MTNGLFVCKIRVLAFFILLCMGVMCGYIFSSAYAESPLPVKSGTSGSCTWKYEEVNGDIVLTIAPTNGIEGTLGQPVVPDDGDNSNAGDTSDDATPGFPWNRLSERENTKRIVVKGKVKAKDSAAYMFWDFPAAESIDLSGLDITGVTDTRRMFEGCSALTTLDVSKLDVSKVINMEGMFVECFVITSLDLSGWNVSNVKNMKNMFSDCSDLTALNMSGWNVSNVTNMKEMFSDCSALAALDLSGWKASPEVSMDEMFKGTKFLRKISLGINFPIKNGAKFEDAGSGLGTKWMQVNLGKGGTYQSPKGKVFESSSELLTFHHDRTKRSTDKEEYLRVAPAKLLSALRKMQMMQQVR